MQREERKACEVLVLNTVGVIDVLLIELIIEFLGGGNRGVVAHPVHLRPYPRLDSDLGDVCFADVAETGYLVLQKRAPVRGDVRFLEDTDRGAFIADVVLEISFSYKANLTTCFAVFDALQCCRGAVLFHLINIFAPFDDTETTGVDHEFFTELQRVISRLAVSVGFVD